LNNIYSIQGGTSSIMVWPTALSNDFTICSMTRYTGGSYGRILDGVGCNWLHGHWQGNRGVAYYDGWLASSSRGTLTDWLVMCGQNSASSSTSAPDNIIADGMLSIFILILYYHS
jgi:hypothetical protein